MHRLHSLRRCRLLRCMNAESSTSRLYSDTCCSSVRCYSTADSILLSCCKGCLNLDSDRLIELRLRSVTVVRHVSCSKVDLLLTVHDDKSSDCSLGSSTALLGPCRCYCAGPLGACCQKHCCCECSRYWIAAAAGVH